MLVFSLVYVIFSTHLENQIHFRKKIAHSKQPFFFFSSHSKEQIFVSKRNNVINWVWGTWICFHNGDDVAVLFFLAFTVVQQNQSFKHYTSYQRTVWIKWLPLQCQSHGRVVLVHLHITSGNHIACSAAGRVSYNFFFFPFSQFNAIITFSDCQCWILSNHCHYLGIKRKTYFLSFSL